MRVLYLWVRFIPNINIPNLISVDIHSCSSSLVIFWTKKLELIFEGFVIEVGQLRLTF